MAFGTRWVVFVQTSLKCIGPETASLEACKKPHNRITCNTSLHRQDEFHGHRITVLFKATGVPTTAKIQIQ